LKAADFIDLQLNFLNQKKCSENDVVDLIEGLVEVLRVNYVVKTLIEKRKVEVIFQVIKRLTLRSQGTSDRLFALRNQFVVETCV